MTTDGDNRTRILEAAEELFAAKGFAATSVREIVTSARVTNPMLYYYFGSKEVLFTTLLRERTDQYVARLEERLAPCATITEVLRAWAEVVLDLTVERPTTTRFVFAAVFGARAGIPTEPVAALGDRVRRVFDSAVARVVPGVAPARVGLAGLLFHGAVSHLVQFCLDTGTGTIPRDVIEAIVRPVAIQLTDTAPLPEAVGLLLCSGPGRGEADE